MFDPTQYPNFMLLLVGAAGLFVLGRGTWIMWEGDGANEWPTVQGVIQRASVNHRMKSSFFVGPVTLFSHEGGYEILVRYAYEVAGHVHASERWSFAGPEIFPDEASAEARAKEFTEGTPVTVHYDPSAPATSVIKCGDRGQSLGMWLSGGASFLWALYGYLDK
jgi:hypothetical protein